jgi:glutamate carboxypeptidase
MWKMDNSMGDYTSYFKWIESQKNTIQCRLKKWAEINTYSSNVKGLAQLLVLLEEDFSSLGGISKRIKLTPHQVLGPNGTLNEEPLGDALIIRKRPSAPIKIFLGGHYDTVFPPCSSFQKVLEVDKEIWNGPGVADMKGGLAILLTAVEAFEMTPFKETIGWEILLTPDEEIGSPGSITLYEEGAKRNDVGLIFEPSFSDGSFVIERKGSVNFTVVVHGKSAHAGRDFHQGKSASLALGTFVHNLSLLKGDFTLNIADLEAKGPVNIVPALASCRINIRSNNPDILEKLSHQIKEMAKGGEGIRFEIIEDSHRTPKLFDAPTKALFQAFQVCAAELNIPFNTVQSGGVCDGNILAEAGLTTFDSLGPVGGHLHTFNEYIQLPSLVERSKLTALFLFKVASKEIILNKEVQHAK